MSFILNIETATRNCSVAIAKDGGTVALKEIATENYSHAEKLHVFIADVLKDAAIGFSDLSAVAVSKGPGSYTGLRIGVSAAKGYCFALGIPLISVDTLEVIARQASVADGLIIPMIDARRMEVYSAIFNADLTLFREVSAEIIDESSFSDINQPIHIIGDCQPKIKSVLNTENFIFHDDILYPSAKEMSAMSFERFKNGSFEDLAYFEPFYLKDFVTGGKS
ncbi:MAG: tRNA (adenosine(37)-N6)-threonylcarbamoyltransferase complex dimerization subunit type 1 TsaB [Flavobacterium sp.]|nr:MAG: tRNA (adenosine(37)-N6)-threonylcarbamoyltransferase complex dimerization subunit type 1 TsaB [Flavobacterium sp.]